MPIRRTYLDIKSESKYRIQTTTPITDFSPTSVTNAFVDIIALESDLIYNEIETIHGKHDPLNNYGTDLDNLGYLVGVSRDQAFVSMDETYTNTYFFLDRSLNSSTVKNLIDSIYPVNTSTNIRQRLYDEGFLNKTGDTLIIPKGTILSSAKDEVQYKTLEKVTLKDADAYVPVIAAGYGANFNVNENALVKHNLGTIAILNNIAKYIQCSNKFSIDSGSNALTDEDYRYKITLKPQERNANEQTIRRIALSVPGVRNILFTRALYGYGTIGVLIDGTSPLVSQGLINIVTNAIGNLSGADAIFVRSPDYKGIELSLQIQVDVGSDADSIKTEVVNLIITYINNLQIGGTIVWNDLVALVMSVTGVFDFSTDYFKIGDYDAFNKTNTKQIILRKINQRSYITDKFYTDKGLISVCSNQG